MRIIGGFFISQKRMRYSKPALNFDQQFDLLTARGLVIAPEQRLRVMRWLKHVSYYRLSAYFLPFKCGETFREGTTFDQVAGLYIFDRKLRLILLDAIERIEVSLRTALTCELATRYGPFGHVNPSNFAPSFKHSEFMAELTTAEKKSRETFVSHYRRKYSEESHLPIWMASELLSFGSLSMLYKACHPDIKRVIARRIEINDVQLSSWFHSLSYIRNVCAHHSRLWNREIAVKPSLPRRSPAWPFNVPSTDRLHCMLVIVRFCLMRLAPGCKWRDRLFNLLDAHPDIDLNAMNFPENWRTLAPWG